MSIKVHVYYQTTLRPWGGVNSFLRAFIAAGEAAGLEFTARLDQKCDIVLLSGPYRDRMHFVDLPALSRLQDYGSPYLLARWIVKRPRKIVYRCDGFRDEYAGLSGDPADGVQKKLLAMADMVIFQNEFCLNSARRPHIGFSADQYRIIYNGVDQDIFRYQNSFWNRRRPLRVCAANWSSNPRKGYAYIADFSELPGVTVDFCGRWMDSIPSKNVNISAPLPNHQLAPFYQAHDALLHPAQFDPSPNVCLEAVSCGLPIIYHATSGIREVAGDCGIPAEDDVRLTYEKFSLAYDALKEVVHCRYPFFSMHRCAKEYAVAFKELCRE